MSDDQHPTENQRSGGVDINHGSVVGDVVGRDKIVHNYHDRTPPAPSFEKSLEEFRNKSAGSLQRKIPLVTAGEHPNPASQADLMAVFVPLRLSRHQKQAEPSPSQAHPAASHRQNTARGSVTESNLLDSNAASSTTLERIECTFDEALRRHDCFVVKGNPGSGKSTLLRSAALACLDKKAAEAMHWSGPDLTPVYIELRAFGRFLEFNSKAYPQNSHRPVIDYLVVAYRADCKVDLPEAFYDTLLSNGQCLILCDGLDEAPELTKTAQHLSKFIDAYRPNNKLCITSRPRGFDYVRDCFQRLDPGLLEFELPLLNPQEMGTLFSNLFKILRPGEESQSSAEHLRNQIDLKPDLYCDIATPLMGTMLALIYDRDRQLPLSEADIYRQIIDLLLGYWKRRSTDRQDYTDISLNDGTGETLPDIREAVETKRKRLSHLAEVMQSHPLREVSHKEAIDEMYQYFRQERQNRLTEQEAGKWAENFLKYMCDTLSILTAFFVEHGDRSKRYAFIHETIREYLTAEAWLGKSADDLGSAVTQAAIDESWRKVFDFLMPRLEDPDKRNILIKALLTPVGNQVR